MLIHANKDTVVSVEQSRLMNRRLKKAGKDVELVVLKGEDHWLSYEDTRLRTLEALQQFLAANL
jgi:dipeptidyl aminopeptidase/acylaminoacyl peptidase